jgi:hypothetical protein
MPAVFNDPVHAYLAIIVSLLVEQGPCREGRFLCAADSLPKLATQEDLKWIANATRLANTLYSK